MGVVRRKKNLYFFFNKLLALSLSHPPPPFSLYMSILDNHLTVHSTSLFTESFIVDRTYFGSLYNYTTKLFNLLYLINRL